MVDTILTVVQAGAVVSIFTYMLSRGLGVCPEDLRYFDRRPELLFRSLLSVDVLVPLLATAIVFLIAPAGPTGIGLLILASSPAAPMVLRKIAKARGSQEYAVSLHLALASLAIVTTPVTLGLLSEATGLRLEVSPLAVAEQVGLSILLPITAGMVSGWLFPALAKRISEPLEALSNFVLTMVILIILLSTYPLLLTMDIRSYLAIALMISGAVLAGHLMAAGSPEEQTTLALESSTRNVGLALLISSAYAPLEKALPVLIPYLVISTIIGWIYARHRKRVDGEKSRPEPE